MTRPPRIVDAHVHLWDPARTEWYPYLSGAMPLDLGDVRGMARRFDADDHRRESGDWVVDRLVHVAAATGRHSVDETLELDARADAQPVAIVGGLLPAETPEETLAAVDQQRAARRLRGVRPMGAWRTPVPSREVLEGLRDRELAFEILARPDDLVAAATGLLTVDDLTVVVEHVGWPRTDTSEERTLCLTGLEALAAVGPNVHCKLSGLAMATGSISAEAYRPWLEPALEIFGVERCLFASNFPVDGMHGTLEEVWAAYDEVTAGLSAADREALFAGNAERLYRL